MAERILITGGSGLLAVNAAVMLRDRYEVSLALHKRQMQIAGVDSMTLGLESVTEFTVFLSEQRPDLVIHTAGMTSVEECEVNPEQAYYVNAILSENVATACNRVEVPLVHISTDHLFRGDAPFLDEDAEVCPLNSYGRSKAEAETKVLSACPDALVVRTNFFCWGTIYRRSFSDIVIESLRSGSALTLFSDVYITPLIAERLVETILKLVSKGTSGIINVVGETRISKYELGLKLADIFGLDKRLIKSGSLDENHDLTLRPKDMSLSSSKVGMLLGRQLGDIEAQINLLYHQELEGIKQEIRTL